MCSPTSTDAGARPLRAARANRVFCADEERIRAENTVMDENKDRAQVLYKIAAPQHR
jgi:hypothetical protein